MGMNISVNTFGNMHPRISVDGNGDPLVIWGRMSDGAVFLARWNGTGFNTPVKLNPAWMQIATASWMGPDIASKGDTVYVVVKKTPETSDTNHVYILTSFDGGNNFFAPVRVDYIADSLSRFPTVTVDDQGNPIVAFMKFNSSFLDSRWVVSRSLDYGNTFNTDVKASGFSGINAEVCDCCPGAVLNSGVNTLMLYRDNLSDIRDIWAGHSNNNLASFDNGFAVDTLNWFIVTCPSSGPDGIIVGDSLYSVFLSAGNGSYRTYLSTSSVSNNALGTFSNLTGSLPGLSQQNYPRIAHSGNAAAIVWKQNINGVAQLPVLFTNDITSGFPSAFDTVDISDITNADVAMSNGKVYVVWQDDNSQTVKFRSGTYVVNTSIEESEQTIFTLFPGITSSSITIKFTGGNPSSSMSIYNITGKQLLSMQIQGDQAEFDVSNLDAGLYFVKVTNSRGVFSQKFLRQ
jgi:hypothetical protein